MSVPEKSKWVTGLLLTGALAVAGWGFAAAELLGSSKHAVLETKIESVDSKVNTLRDDMNKQFDRLFASVTKPE